MAVFKQGPRPEDNYTMIGNDLARHKEISLRAKGMYLFMRSHRDGWKLTIENIAKAVGLSKDTVFKDINELIDAGYIIREQGKGKGGRFGEVEYMILSSPHPEISVPATTSENDPNPQVAPHPELPDTDSPDAANQDYKKTILNNTISNNIKEDEKDNVTQTSDTLFPSFDDEHIDPEALLESQFNEFWEKYPRHDVTKKLCRTSLKRALKKVDFNDLMIAVDNYTISKLGTEKRFIKLPTTWLNQELWELHMKSSSSPDSSGNGSWRNLLQSTRDSF